MVRSADILLYGQAPRGIGIGRYQPLNHRFETSPVSCEALLGALSFADPALPLLVRTPGSGHLRVRRVNRMMEVWDDQPFVELEATERLTEETLLQAGELIEALELSAANAFVNVFHRGESLPPRSIRLAALDVGPAILISTEEAGLC